MRYVLAAVPAVLHKVDPFAAGVVLAAVFAPVFGRARGPFQVDRRAVHRYPLDDSRLPIEYSWRRVAADVDLAIEAGLADADGHPDVGREGRKGGGDPACGADQTR